MDCLDMTWLNQTNISINSTKLFVDLTIEHDSTKSLAVLINGSFYYLTFEKSIFCCCVFR